MSPSAEEADAAGNLLASLPGCEEALGVVTSLADIARCLGPSALTVACAPKGDEIPVGRCVIYDPSDPPAIEPGDIALLIGVRGATAVTVGAINDCAPAEAAAVAIKGLGSNLAEIDRASRAAGVAVLAVPDDMSWETLHVLLRAALQASGPAPAGRRASPLEHLFHLANETAELAGGHCAITDDRLVVIAYSTLAHAADPMRLENILGRRDTTADEKFRSEGGVRAFLAGADFIRFEPPGGGRARLTVPIRAGAEFLGVVSVIEPDAGPQGCKEALTGAALIAVPHMLRYIALEEKSRHAHDELLRSVLNGRSLAHQLAHEMGLPVDGDWLAAALRPCGDVRWRRPGGEFRRVKHLVSIALAGHSRHSLVVDTDDDLYAVLPVPKPSSRESITALISRVVCQIRNDSGIEVAAALGRTVGNLSQISESRAEADLVLPILTKRARAEVGELGDVRNELVLVRLRELVKDDVGLLTGRVDALTALESHHEVGYVASVRAFLDAFGDVGVAAGRLFVHPNTLRYRLRRIKEVCGLDLGDPDERFVLDFQLRMMGL
jgi:hypothetical protein